MAVDFGVANVIGRRVVSLLKYFEKQTSICRSRNGGRMCERERGGRKGGRIYIYRERERLIRVYASRYLLSFHLSCSRCVLGGTPAHEGVISQAGGPLSVDQRKNMSGKKAVGKRQLKQNRKTGGLLLLTYVNPRGRGKG